MIGQSVLQRQISLQIEEAMFPRFSLIVGDKGSGKKTLASNIYGKIFQEGIGKYILEDVKVENVSKMIEMAYKVRNTLFCIFDADGMSVAAKNSMLKVVEECPNNNYFLMTLEDENNTLDTIRSRASIYRMQKYSSKEILEFFDSHYPGQSESYRDIVKAVCETPGEVEILQLGEGADKFYKYTELVLDNIEKVSGANSFKIADKVALKDEKDKYNLKLFWKMFTKICIDKAISCFEEKEDDAGIRYCMGAKITSKMVKGLRVKGINKMMLFDMWLLDIRKEWM